MVQGLNIGKNALIVNQAALSVVGNNIANMNTVGYSKQRVNLSAVYTSANAENATQKANSGYGVTIESITRYRDAFLDAYYRDTTSSKNYYETISQNGLILENIANEFNDTGLSGFIDSFFSAANNLSLYPTDPTMKTDFVQQAANLATELNNIATQLNNARTNLVGNIADIASMSSCTANAYVNEINQLLDDIRKVNENIIYQNGINVGASSGLLDERDALIDKLSEYIPVEIEYNENGGVNISLSNIQLIGGKNLHGHFQTNIGDYNNPTIVSFESEDGHIYSNNVQSLLGQGGKLAAVLTLGGNSTSELTVKSMIDNLDKIAQEFAREVNNLQLKKQYNADGDIVMTSAYYNSKTQQLEKATSSIFTSADGKAISATNITINKSILNNPQLVATAWVEVDGAGNIKKPDEVGNNIIAQAMTDLREQGITGLKGLTFEDFNTTITSDFGSKLNSAKINTETQEKILQSANEKRESAIGVNIEEELMDLIKYQRAYEASARVFTTSSEILEVLVNLAK